MRFMGRIYLVEHAVNGLWVPYFHIFHVLQDAIEFINDRPIHRAVEYERREVAFNSSMIYTPPPRS